MSGGKWRPAGRGGLCWASGAVLKAPAVMGQDSVYKEGLAAEGAGRGPRARGRETAQEADAQPRQVAARDQRQQKCWETWIVG